VTNPMGAGSTVWMSYAVTNACTPALPSPPGRWSTTTGCCHWFASNGVEAGGEIETGAGAELNDQSYGTDGPLIKCRSRTFPRQITEQQP
jgi:hypothetical protein